MSTSRWITLVALAAFMCAVVTLSVRPWTWHGAIAAPASSTVQTVAYRCGPVLGSSYVHGPSSVPYPVIGTPCGQRSQYRDMALLDIAGTVVVVMLLVGLPRRRDRRRDLVMTNP